MKKLKMHSNDLTEQNVENLMQLFPNCVTESQNKDGELVKVLDFDLLKQELSKNIVEGPTERYHLNWPGKREAVLTANAPIAKTLRPCPEESVNFDTTQNIFIEGDNLDALKLLQNNYLGKVKMIYIDPPYNTGNDFIYEDDFAENRDEYLQKSNQKDEEGNRLVSNTESNGRFHSDWLSMMYPRLKLARNLLREDGVIFISIDDNEVHNLRKVCDEVFGEGRFIAQFPWRKRISKSDVPFGVSQDFEWIILYAKSNLISLGLQFDRKYYTTSDFPDDRWRISDLTTQKIEADRPNSAFDLVNPKNGQVYKYNPKRLWGITKDTFQEYYNKGKIVFPGDYDFLKITIPAYRVFESEDIKKSLQKYGKNIAYKAVSTVLDDSVKRNDAGSKDLFRLFDKKIFSFPKPTSLVQFFIKVVNSTDAIILDFFAGSSTTAHAVMKLNAEDQGKRKFIMVQLPEACDEKSEAFKAGYKNIAEISKERIRRAGQKIKDENPMLTTDLDIGFRVLKVDTSNMNDVYYRPDKVEQSLLDIMTDNIKSDRTAEDLLFQVMLDWGLELTLRIEKLNVHGINIYSVENNSLIACFASKGEVIEDLVKEIANKKPMRVVFRDSGFKDDATKINVEQIFKLLSPSTDVRTI